MKKYLAEFLGTFFLVFCGTGAIIINQESGGTVTHTGVAITFGLIVMVMIYTFGDISGAHLNPAVSIAFALAKLFNPKEVLPFIISQFSGGILASLLLHVMFPLNNSLGNTLPAGSWVQSAILEYILTFMLMLVILQVSSGSKEKGILAGMAIGAVILLEAMFAGPISGASMNPARSLAPALISRNLSFVWVYLLFPTLGAGSAVFCWNYLKS